MERLKPCPFCGGMPQIELFNDGYFDYARISCCRLIYDWCGDKTGELIIEAWNKRIEPVQLTTLRADNERLEKELAETKEQLNLICVKCVWELDSLQCKSCGCAVRGLRGLAGREGTE